MLSLLPRVRCQRLLLRLRQLMALGVMSVEQLKQTHAQMIAAGLCEWLPFRNLVEGYSAVSAPDYVRLLYRQQVDHDRKRFIWNVLIRHSPPEEALLLYASESGRRGGVFLVPDNRTFTSVLVACALSLALWEGKQIHAQILKTASASSDVAVQTTGVHLYARCWDIDSARQLFDEIPLKASVSWNAMISGYSSLQERGGGRRPTTTAYASETLVLFRAMLQQQQSRPTETTMVGLLAACSHLGVLPVGSCIHGYIQKTIPLPDEHVFIGTALVDMYSKCGCLTSARQVFERMKERRKGNALTWTAMIAGLAIHGRGKEAVELLDAMVVDKVAVPNAVTFTCVLSACCHAGLVEEGVNLFSSMTSRFGIRPRIQHYGCMVDLLGRAGLVEEAYVFIRQMPLKPDVVLWRMLLSACRMHGNVILGERVGKMVIQQQQQQKHNTNCLPADASSSSSSVNMQKLPTSEDYIALSNLYASAERWEDVGAVRRMMQVQGIHNEPGYSCIQVAAGGQ